jgi:hypothetical protein
MLACLALLAAQAPAAAKSVFDGSWRVSATTTGGSCDRSFSYRIVIIDGRVMSGDIRGVSGSVAASGSVTVSVRRDDGTVVGSGHLGASSGSGRWTAQSRSGKCVGAWQAERVS